MVADFSDQPTQVRQGEELDAARLEAYFAEHTPDFSGPLEIMQFPGGYSNLTYLVRLGDRELILRRPPIGAQIKTAHDMWREYHILFHLSTVYSKSPRPLAYCEDPAVLGAPFYVMERVRGVILRNRQPQGLKLEPKTLGRLAIAFVENLVQLHAVDYAACGLGDLGRPEGYVARQVAGWTKRYATARTDDLPDMEAAAIWMATHQPADSGAALIHND